MTTAVVLLQRSVAALALLIALGGCYNATNHALAQSVQSRFKEMHISASLDGEKALSRELLTRELEVVERQQQANRDLALAEAIDSDWATFQQSIHDRAKELFGNRVTIAELGAAADAIEAWNDQREELSRRQKQLMDEFSLEVRCPLPAGLARPANDSVRELLEGYDKACQQSREALKHVPAAGGDLAEVRERIRKQVEEIDGWHEKSKVAKHSYVAAVRAYEGSVAAGAMARGELVRRRKAIDAALQQMHDAGPIGELEELDARHIRIQALIIEKKENRSRKDGPETVAEVVASAVITLPLLQSSHALPLLEVEAQRLQSERRRAQAEQRIAETRLKLLYAEQNALFAGVLRLSEASAAAENAGKIEGSKCIDASLPITRIFAQSTGPCRTAIAKALIAYSELWTVGRIPAAQARWMAFGLSHEEAIDESIAILEQWESVLATPLAHLVAYHGSGVKPDILAQILIQAAQAISVGAIAAGMTIP